MPDKLDVGQRAARFQHCVGLRAGCTSTFQKTMMQEMLKGWRDTGWAKQSPIGVVWWDSRKGNKSWVKCVASRQLFSLQSAWSLISSAAKHIQCAQLWGFFPPVFYFPIPGGCLCPSDLTFCTQRCECPTQMSHTSTGLPQSDIFPATSGTPSA